MLSTKLKTALGSISISNFLFILLVLIFFLNFAKLDFKSDLNNLLINPFAFEKIFIFLKEFFLYI